MGQDARTTVLQAPSAAGGDADSVAGSTGPACAPDQEDSMSDQQTAQRPSLAGPVPTRPPYDARPATILLVVEWVLGLAGLIAMVLVSWLPDRCGVSGACDIALETDASRLWVVGTIAVLVLSTVATVATVTTVVRRTRRVPAAWAPVVGIALILAINVAVQIMTGVALR